MTNKEKIHDLLKDIPSKWRNELTDILYEIQCERNAPTCDEVKDCQTVTSLSDFTVEGTTVGIVYKDENLVSYTRSFDIEHVVDNVLDLTPGCLTDITTWNTLTLTQKLQLWINSFCNCCSTTTTTTTLP